MQQISHRGTLFIDRDSSEEKVNFPFPTEDANSAKSSQVLYREDRRWIGRQFSGDGLMVVGFWLLVGDISVEFG